MTKLQKELAQVREARRRFINYKVEIINIKDKFKAIVLNETGEQIGCSLPRTTINAAVRAAFATI